MKVFRQFALIFAVFLPLVAPAMACAVPGAHLSSTERACCKQMKPQCGNMNMPASHGCCHKDVSASGYLNAMPASQFHIAVSHAVTPNSLPILQLLAVATDRGPVDREGTLPQSPPAAISVLRI
jgi:hypothetical protein